MNDWTTNIQWKGTNLCMDFICPDCGCNSHFDGMFANYIRCCQCKSVFKMPTDISVTKVTTFNITPLEGEI